MKLLINGQEIQFEYGEEKNAQEIVDSVSDWAVKRDLILSEVYIDSEFYTLDNIPEQELDKIDEINCTIQSRAELVIASLTEGAAYCDRVIAYIDASSESEKFEIGELEGFYKGVEWMKEMTLSVFQIVDLDVKEIKHYDQTVDDYLSDLSKIIADLSKKTKEEDVLKYLSEKRKIFEEFRGIYKLVLMSDKLKQMITKSLDSPDSLIQLLKEMKTNNASQMENLEKIAELYQSGNDADALEKMHIFLDYIYTYTRTTYQTAPVFNVDPADIEVDGMTLEETNNELNSFLAEIIEVMENNDIISLADILEYEIKPLMENTEKYIEKILDKIVK